MSKFKFDKEEDDADYLKKCLKESEHLDQEKTAPEQLIRHKSE
jgi:hypothetical protein